MTYGFDTGFFYEFLDASSDERIEEAWADLGSEATDGVLSYLVFYELYKHALRGALPREQTETLVTTLPAFCPGQSQEKVSGRLPPLPTGISPLAWGKASQSDALPLNLEGEIPVGEGVKRSHRQFRFLAIALAFCHVVAIDEPKRCERAARLAHGNGLSMADAFILDAALTHDADRIYTTDADLEWYEGEDIEIVLL